MMRPKFLRALKKRLRAYRKKLMLILAGLQAEEPICLLPPQLHFSGRQFVPLPEVPYIQKAVLVMRDDILKMEGVGHFM